MADRLESKVRSLPDRDLFAMFEKPDDYIPMALNYARDEMQRRGGWEDMKNRVTAELIGERIAEANKIKEKENELFEQRNASEERTNKERPYYILVFAALLIILALAFWFYAPEEIGKLPWLRILIINMIKYFIKII